LAGVNLFQIGFKGRGAGLGSDHGWQVCGLTSLSFQFFSLKAVFSSPFFSSGFGGEF
jgi:hypothetical protein